MVSSARHNSNQVCAANGRYWRAESRCSTASYVAPSQVYTYPSHTSNCPYWIVYLIQMLALCWRNFYKKFVHRILDVTLKTAPNLNSENDYSSKELLVSLLLAWKCKGWILLCWSVHYSNVYNHHHLYRLPFGRRWHFYAMVTIFWNR